MRYLEAHQKPLIDLTVMDEDDWRAEIEEEIARLNETITMMLFYRRVA